MKLFDKRNNVRWTMSIIVFVVSFGITYLIADEDRYSWVWGVTWAMMMALVLSVAVFNMIHPEPKKY